MDHLNKKSRSFLILSVAVALMVITIPLAIWVTHSQTAQLANSRDRCNAGQHASNYTTLKNNSFNPAYISGHLCDTLTFINDSGKTVIIGFGPHEHHISYDGISERLLGQGQSFTITFIKAGTYNFHEHILDIAKGSFTVS